MLMKSIKKDYPTFIDMIKWWTLSKNYSIKSGSIIQMFFDTLMKSYNRELSLPARFIAFDFKTSGLCDRGSKVATKGMMTVHPSTTIDMMNKSSENYLIVLYKNYKGMRKEIKRYWSSDNFHAQIRACFGLSTDDIEDDAVLEVETKKLIRSSAITSWMIRDVVPFEEGYRYSFDYVKIREGQKFFIPENISDETIDLFIVYGNDLKKKFSEALLTKIDDIDFVIPASREREKKFRSPKNALPSVHPFDSTNTGKVMGKVFKEFCRFWFADKDAAVQTIMDFVGDAGLDKKAFQIKSYCLEVVPLLKNIRANAKALLEKGVTFLDDKKTLVMFECFVSMILYLVILYDYFHCIQAIGRKIAYHPLVRSITDYIYVLFHGQAGDTGLPTGKKCINFRYNKLVDVLAILYHVYDVNQLFLLYTQFPKVNEVHQGVKKGAEYIKHSSGRVVFKTGEVDTTLEIIEDHAFVVVNSKKYLYRLRGEKRMAFCHVLSEYAHRHACLVYNPLLTNKNLEDYCKGRRGPKHLQNVKNVEFRVNHTEQSEEEVECEYCHGVAQTMYDKIGKKGDGFKQLKRIFENLPQKFASMRYAEELLDVKVSQNMFYKENDITKYDQKKLTLVKMKMAEQFKVLKSNQMNSERTKKFPFLTVDPDVDTGYGFRVPRLIHGVGFVYKGLDARILGYVFHRDYDKTLVRKEMKSLYHSVSKKARQEIVLELKEFPKILKDVEEEYSRLKKKINDRYVPKTFWNVRKKRQVGVKSLVGTYKEALIDIMAREIFKIIPKGIELTNIQQLQRFKLSTIDYTTIATSFNILPQVKDNPEYKRSIEQLQTFRNKKRKLIWEALLDFDYIPMPTKRRRLR